MGKSKHKQKPKHTSYSKIILDFRKSQMGHAKVLRDKQIHPRLVCDIEPDVRPFEWVSKKKERRQVETEQLSLFDKYDTDNTD